MTTFDVFLAHNSDDKQTIELICQYLQKLGLNPWLDKQQLRPGNVYQDVIQATIQEIQCAAIFIGENGLGRWQSIEIRAFIKQCVKNNIQVIPVLLPGVKNLPENLVFLEDFHAVWFENEIEKDFEAFKQLYWGIADKPLEIDIITFYELKSKVTPRPLEIKLESEKGVDYTRLRDLLKAKNWYEADKETLRVMLQAVGEEKNDYLEYGKISKFPCTDLRTIDRLWVKYSNGHFGFSVQKQIYLDVHEDKDVFLGVVGWKVKVEVVNFWHCTFALEAKKGHLPSPRINVRYITYGYSQVWNRSDLFSRIETCKL